MAEQIEPETGARKVAPVLQYLIAWFTGGVMKRIVLSMLVVVFSTGMLFGEYKEALKLYEEDKYQESLDKIAESLVVSEDFDPESQNYRLRYLAGHNHWKLGNVDSAVIHLKRCAEIRKDTADPYIDLGFLMIDNNRYRPAAVFAREAIKREETALGYYVLGLAYSGMKSYWKSKEYLEKANSLNTEMYLSYNELGNVLMKLKRYTEAQTAYATAHALHPGSAKVLNNLAVCNEQLGNSEKARQYIKQAHEIDGSNRVIAENYNSMGTNKP